MEVEHEFEAVLEADPSTGELLVVVPFVVSEAYGTKDELPVQTTLDGFPYPGTLTPLGDGYHGLIVPRTVRRAISKTVGDVLRVALRHDATDRTLPPPDDLATALATAPAALAGYRKLTLPEQREYLRYLQGAKTPDIRAKRLTETLYRLERGLKRA